MTQTEHEVKGGIWGSYPKKKERAMDKEMAKVRKKSYLFEIMGKLEAYTQKPVEEWGGEEEKSINDILTAVEHEVKAQLSNNNGEYVG